MADVTGGTAPTNGSTFDVPGDIQDVYDHFGAQSMYSVANAASLPGSGNWVGKILQTEDTDYLYMCTGLPGTWLKIREDTGWITLTLSASWVDFGGLYRGARYRRLNGQTYVQGMIKNGTVTPGTVIGNLPAGFRPGAALQFSTWSSAGAASLDVLASGNIVINAAAATSTSITFPSFAAEA